MKVKQIQCWPFPLIKLVFIHIILCMTVL